MKQVQQNSGRGLLTSTPALQAQYPFRLREINLLDVTAKVNEQHSVAGNILIVENKLIPRGNNLLSPTIKFNNVSSDQLSLTPNGVYNIPFNKFFINADTNITNTASPHDTNSLVRLWISDLGDKPNLNNFESFESFFIGHNNLINLPTAPFSQFYVSTVPLGARKVTVMIRQTVPVAPIITIRGYTRIANLQETLFRSIASLNDIIQTFDIENYVAFEIEYDSTLLGAGTMQWMMEYN